MSTAQDVIEAAMRDIGALASGEDPSSDETADVLEALNNLIDSWNTDGLTLYAEADVSHTLVANDGSYTIAASGADITATRPVRILRAYVRDSNIDYPLEIISKEAYDLIPDKTTTSTNPEYLYYEPSYANGTIKLWPVPTDTNSLVMTVQTQLSSFATAATSFAMPPGYQRALQKNLGIEIAPMFEKEPSAALVKAARDSLAMIKRLNHKTPRMETGLDTGRNYDINSDQ